jgi:hypothetical protein
MSDVTREMPASRSGGEPSGTIAYYARAYRREGLAPGATQGSPNRLPPHTRPDVPGARRE